MFVVGDDDQSIYRFQGANIENMLQFANTYKDDLLKVVLVNNYRSVQPILDISRSLIGRNEERLIRKIEGLSKELVSSKETISHLKHLPKFQEYETERQEMIGIVHQVQELVARETAPGRIGIIYKENKYGEELAQYFKLLNIPVYTKRHIDILKLPFAQKLTLILKYLATEHDIAFSGDEMLFELLHFDWFQIPPLEIAKLSIENAEKKSKGESSSLRRLLAEKSAAPAKDLFTSAIHHSLARASRIMEELIADVPNTTLQALFENIIRKTGSLQQIMLSNDKHWQLQVLTRLFDFIKEETHRNAYLKLKDLVGLIELMEKEKISLPLVQVSGTDRGVNLMTAHGSKGLEFEHIFFAGCNSCFWEKKRKPGSGYKLPDTLFSSQPTGDEQEELRRLFYVAITRAEQYLYISYSRFNNEGK